MRRGGAGRRWAAAAGLVGLLAPMVAGLAPALIAVLAWTVLPAEAGPFATNTTFTVSNTTSNHYTDVDDPPVDVHDTRVTAVLDGVIVFDQTTPHPVGSPEVDALLADAANTLATMGGGPPTGPVTVSSTATPENIVEEILPTRRRKSRPNQPSARRRSSSARTRASRSSSRPAP